MATVTTVVGPIDTSKLGFTLSHEHVLTSSACFRHVYPEVLDRDLAIKAAVRLLGEAKKEGLNTIVDCTPMDLDRDVALLEEVSVQTGVNIICSTGSHLYIPRTFYETMFPWMQPMSPDRVADLWVREIEVGIEGTGIKAGIIKVSTNDPIRPPEELMLRAAARTHLRTGLLITTHTPMKSRVGLEQLRILKAEGVDLTKVYVGHVNSTLDADYHKRIADQGVWLGMDHFHPAGAPGTETWEQRTEFIAGLIKDGYGDRIMLSHDWNVGFHARRHEAGETDPHPHGYAWVGRAVLPKLRELGVSERDVKKLMVDNPRGFFEGADV
jgi:phosphotriesterase-related protein